MPNTNQINTIFEQFENNKKMLDSSISALFQKKNFLSEKFLEQLKNFYLEHPQILVDERIQNQLQNEQIVELLASIAGIRPITFKELQFNYLMSYIENTLSREKDNKKSKIYSQCLSIFNNLENDSTRFWFSMYCSGTCSIFKHFEPSNDFINNFIGISTKTKLNTNYLLTRNYNPYTEESTVEIYIHKNSSKNFNKIIKSIKNIFLFESKNDKISICNSDPNYSYNFYLSLSKNENNEIYPKIIKKRFNTETVIFESKKEDETARLQESLEYISKNLWATRY